MTLMEAMRPDMIILDLEVDSEEDLLMKIAETAATSPLLEGVGVRNIFNALRARESLGSTACGHGIAVPHCRLVGIEGFVAGIALLKHPVDFRAGDGEQVGTAAFVIGPEDRPREHLRLLSTLAQTFRSSEVRERVGEASTPEEVRALIAPSVGESEQTSAAVSSRLVQIFVQEESVFDDILQVISATETANAVVLSADESTRYLMDIPFFAGFWNTDIRSFNRIIVAVIREELVNATVRNIEFVCGRLDERSDVMITVSGLAMVKGSLGGQ